MEMAGSSNYAPDVSAPTQDLKFMLTSNVNVSNFVSVKLLGRNNYNIWKAQMLCLIESQLLLHIINAEHPFPENKGVDMISQYDKLVKGWIFGSVEEKVLKDFVDLGTAREAWMKLESIFNPPTSDIEEGNPSNELDVSTQTVEDLRYMQASNVNVSSFVSVKLLGHSNYKIWSAQMFGLIESQELLYFIDNSYPLSRDIIVFFQRGSYKRYDKLVQGWIFSTLNEKLLKNFLNLEVTTELWMRLESTFNPRSNEEGSPGFLFQKESIRDVPEIENTDTIRLKKELYEAAVEGCWWKAKSILKVEKFAATEAITANGNTILHLAVEMGHNYFVEKLLGFLKDGEVIEKKNNRGRTALFSAAVVGNEYAAQLLVQKRKELLWIKDNHNMSPLDISNKYSISTYFLKTAPPSYWKPARRAIQIAIVGKQYDLAGELLKKFPKCASSSSSILKAMTITFPSDLGFTESFIYPSFHSVLQKTIERGSLLFHGNFLDKCVDDMLRLANTYKNTWCSWFGKNSMIVPIFTLYPIYQLICLLIMVLRLPFSMLYFLLWKVLAVTVPPIKNIEKKKNEYKEAKNILSLICSQIELETPNFSYTFSLFEAVRRDAYEVVDEIIFRYPSTLNYKDEEGHNVVQLAVINRSEKVYNLIHHIIEHIEGCRKMKDSSENNLVHLAGRLAPANVLDRTTGAALQLQRELLWRAEVAKLMLPQELTEHNTFEETPSMVFTREHKDLMKEGEMWMKTTAESCSITAALIVTVVFAAAITVPGGSNQESGVPVFRKEFAFTIFAVSNAFSLFTAATALLLFLSILTARFSERDFLVSLPTRLIFGLLTLFLSTTAMMVAFGAILFLVFCDQRPWMLAPICAFACMPISVIVTVKLPLLADLIRSTYFPIFGKQSYLESCKVNRKNTIFTE